MKKHKLIRITTVPTSLLKLLEDQLSFMNVYYEVIAISSNKETLAKVKESEGVDVFNVEMTRKITPFRDLLAVWNLYKYFKVQKPFIVHTHTPKAGTVGMIAAKLAGVPNRLHTVAGLPLMEAKGFKRVLLNVIEKLTYAAATKVYPNSKGLYKFILKNKFTSQSKLKVIANGSTNGINMNHFDRENIQEDHLKNLRAELNISANDFVFIFVGRLVSDKGVNELIDAFIRLSNTTAKLLLVGPFEEDLDPLSLGSMEEIETNERIKYVGFQQDVRPYLALSDCLVFPSYREGFPNVVMQAGAMGLPSIVSDINGCNEIIVEGNNGTIIPLKNANTLYEAMLKMMKSNEYRELLKNNARKMIQTRYDQKFVWEAILEEYRALDTLKMNR